MKAKRSSIQPHEKLQGKSPKVNLDDVRIVSQDMLAKFVVWHDIYIKSIFEALYYQMAIKEGLQKKMPVESGRFKVRLVKGSREMEVTDTAS